MNKEKIKGVIIGMLISSIFSIGIVFADDLMKMIEVLPNTMTVIVNNKVIEADNFLYEGTTYLPIRAVSEALGKDVQYDANTKTAIISEKEDDSMNIINKNKHIPDKELIENDMVFQDDNGIYYIGVMGMDYVVNNVRGTLDSYTRNTHWDTKTQELIFYTGSRHTKDSIELYRYKYEVVNGLTGIPYDIFVDEILPKIQVDVEGE